MTAHDIVIGFLLFFPWALIAVGLVGAGLQRGGIEKLGKRPALAPALQFSSGGMTRKVEGRNR